MKKEIFKVCVFGLVTLSLVTGCSNDEKKPTKENKESNVTITEESNITSNVDSNITSNVTSNKVSNTTSNKTDSKYIKMNVRDMSTGKVTTYEVDNYAQGVGAAGMSNNYYFVKDNTLYYVSAAKPTETTKVANRVKYVVWDNSEGFIAIADVNMTTIDKDASYLKYATATFENELVVKDMDTLKETKIKVDNYAEPYGAAGMSNTKYYLLNNDLYMVSAADPTSPDKIATGVKYIGFADKDQHLYVIADSNYKAINIPNNGYINIVK